MRVRDEIHVPVAFIPEENPPVTTEEAAVWIQEPAWKLRIRENFLAPYGNITFF
jgi:hypothetical protein